MADWQWIERDERKVHLPSFLNVLTHIGLGTYNLRQKDERAPTLIHICTPALFLWVPLDGFCRAPPLCTHPHTLAFL